MLFKVIQIFPNVVDLMTFVEQAIQSDPNEIPQAFLDEKSKYRTFLKLPFYAENSNCDEFWCNTYCTYRMLMDIPKIKALFKSRKHNRFLMHLVIHHTLVMNKNSIRIRLMSIEPSPTNRRDICTHTGLLNGYFEHSCAPNVLRLDRDGYSVYMTIRPVKKGEQLFVTILDLLLEPKETRQKILWESGHFRCACTLCAGPSATPEQRKQLLSDPLYNGCFGNVEQYAAILQKYGHGPLCEEIKNVLYYYCMQIRYKYTGPINVRALAEIISDSFSNK